MNVLQYQRLAYGIALLVASHSAIAGCGGDDAILPPLTTPRTDAGGDAALDASAVADATPDAKPFDAGTNVVASPIVINEISPGDEWVELVNSSSVAVDLEGYRVADRDKTSGDPKLSESVRFPKGTVLAPNAYLLVRGGGAGGDPLGNADAGKPDAGDAGDAGKAAAKPCPPGGQSYCFNAAFGISNKAGETIYLLAPDQSLKGSVVYPPLAVATGQSYSRIPSGVATAPFKANVETPGAVNRE
jgi:Lamin Tail Domain